MARGAFDHLNVAAGLSSQSQEEEGTVSAAPDTEAFATRDSMRAVCWPIV